MFPVSYVSVPLEMDEGRGAVAFADIEQAGARRTGAARARRGPGDATGVLARIATLVAEGAASEDVFAGIAKEVPSCWASRSS